MSAVAEDTARVQAERRASNVLARVFLCVPELGTYSSELIGAMRGLGAFALGFRWPQTRHEAIWWNGHLIYQLLLQGKRGDAASFWLCRQRPHYEAILAAWCGAE
ncbi:MAG: hypothetical protein M5U01_09665 [Ardenticatenaceae bacterium]|nr:hypothetical protein [Ardenticatenaceae bacterium]